MNKGLTIQEILIVLALTAIIAGLGVANYKGFGEKEKSKEGEFNLELIYQAEKRYFLDHQDKPEKYYICDAPCTITKINNALDINITGSYFNYSIEKDVSGNGFIATATRKNTGICANKIMTLTHNDGPVTKECERW